MVICSCKISDVHFDDYIAIVSCIGFELRENISRVKIKPFWNQIVGGSYLKLVKRKQKLCSIGKTICSGGGWTVLLTHDTGHMKRWYKTLSSFLIYHGIEHLTNFKLIENETVSIHSITLNCLSS